MRGALAPPAAALLPCSDPREHIASNRCSGGAMRAVLSTRAVEWASVYSGEVVEHRLSARQRRSLDGLTRSWYELTERTLPCGGACDGRALVVVRPMPDVL
eukprot:368401-Prymnesium_polylepis.2